MCIRDRSWASRSTSRTGARRSSSRSALTSVSYTHLNVFATYSHGSLLPKNPVLADFILQTALARKYDHVEPLTPLDDEIENRAHDYMEERLRRG